MTDGKYSVVAEDEKSDHNVPQTLRRRSRLHNIFLGLTSLAVFLGLILVGVNLATARTLHADEEILEQKPQWMQSHEAKARANGDEYLLGVGKADITGPVVELNFMGYASLAQVGTGLRQRIYSRSFIIGDVSNPTNRFVYMVLDCAMGDTAIRYGILEALAAKGGEYAQYVQGNVAVTGTHQHSGPGAWLNYLLPQVTSLGFSKQSYQAIVDGAVLSIVRAHESITTGYLSYGETNITSATQGDANINRSPYAYLANPAEERAMYDYDVDKTLTMLRFQRANDSLNIGVLTWFSVHGTSMLENNTHVTGDNKGVAAYLFEQAALNDSTAAKGFVAGFSQSSVADTTPNVLGAYCDDDSGSMSGQMCTLANSTCNGVSETCHGRGPEFQKLDLGVSSCYEVGRRQYQGAKDLYNSFDSVSTPVKDTSVKSFHYFQDMQFFKFPLSNGSIGLTCPAALGYSFAAGTTDGPGAFDFTQNDSGSPDANPFWAVVADLLTTPTAAQVSCQHPKPVLLDVGQMSLPYEWSPNIIDVQLMRVGQFIMIVSPSEVSTMSGRRWKKAITAAANNISLTTTTPHVVIGAPANTYAHYLTTEEEYGIQRYEGASTLYGPHELEAYIYLTTSHIGYLSSTNTSSPPPGPSPPNNVNNSLSFIAGVVYDNPPLLKSFGDVLTAPSASYAIGAVVNTTFVGANPRNNLRLEGTFTAVEKLDAAANTWAVVRDDRDWNLVYTWYRDDALLGTSKVVVSWETAGELAGTYRVRYYGDSKAPITGKISAFEGVSGKFTLA